MKRTIMIVALVFGMGFLFTSAVKAIHPMQITGIVLNISKDVRFEKDIMLEDWMLSVESFSSKAAAATEKEPEVSSWMIESSWAGNDGRLATEPELKLEDWMMGSFNSENRSIALEDWMLNTAG